MQNDSIIVSGKKKKIENKGVHHFKPDAWKLSFKASN